MKAYYYRNPSQSSITTNYKINDSDLGSNYYVSKDSFVTPFYKYPTSSNYKVNTYYSLFTYCLFANDNFKNNNSWVNLLDLTKYYDSTNFNSYKYLISRTGCPGLNKFKIETALTGPNPDNYYYIITRNYDLSYFFNGTKTTSGNAKNGFNLLFSLYNNSENDVSYVLERRDSVSGQGFHILNGTTGIDVTNSLFGASTLSINPLPTKLGFIMWGGGGGGGYSYGGWDSCGAGGGGGAIQVGIIDFNSISSTSSTKKIKLTIGGYGKGGYRTSTDETSTGGSNGGTTQLLDYNLNYTITRANGGNGGAHSVASGDAKGGNGGSYYTIPNSSSSLYGVTILQSFYGTTGGDGTHTLPAPTTRTRFHNGSNQSFNMYPCDSLGYGKILYDNGVVNGTSGEDIKLFNINNSNYDANIFKIGNTLFSSDYTQYSMRTYWSPVGVGLRNVGLSIGGGVGAGGFSFGYPASISTGYYSSDNSHLPPTYLNSSQYGAGGCGGHSDLKVDYVDNTLGYGANGGGGGIIFFY